MTGKIKDNQPLGKKATLRRRELKALARRLGHRFKDMKLLDRALRHSSYAHEYPEDGPSNEQLEFLGDAVLSLTVSDFLLGHFPESSEGELSRRRAAMVNTQQLAALARELDLGSYLLLGRGEKQQAGGKKTSLLANALEAVLAAVFLDSGLKAAKKLTHRWFGPLLRPEAPLAWQDAKTALQEFTQALYKISPTYHLLEESGPSHSRCFRIELRLESRALAQGHGPTKKQAEQMAAHEALELLQGELEEECGGGG